MLIFGVDDVDVEARRIHQQGGVILLGPTNFPDWGYRGMYLRDPDGNLVELLTSIPAEEWTEDLRKADEKYKAAPDGA